MTTTCVTWPAGSVVTTTLSTTTWPPISSTRATTTSASVTTPSNSRLMFPVLPVLLLLLVLLCMRTRVTLLWLTGPALARGWQVPSSPSHTRPTRLLLFVARVCATHQLVPTGVPCSTNTHPAPAAAPTAPGAAGSATTAPTTHTWWHTATNMVCTTVLVFNTSFLGANCKRSGQSV